MIKMVLTCAGCDKRSPPMGGHHDGWRECIANDVRAHSSVGTLRFCACSAACIAPGLKSVMAVGKSRGPEWVSVCDGCQKVVGPSPLPDGNPGLDLQVMSWNLHACDAACLERAVVALPLDPPPALVFGEFSPDAYVDRLLTEARAKVRAAFEDALPTLLAMGEFERGCALGLMGLDPAVLQTWGLHALPPGARLP
jgi:hypothetical protein